MEQLNLFEFLHETFKFSKPIRLIELFAGYGSQAMALEKLKHDGLLTFEHHKVIEFDKYAVKSYNAVHGTNFETKDIRNVHSQDLEIVDRGGYHYLLTYSFPCQDLSKAGKGKGMSKDSGTRSGLLWEVERILRECYRDNCLPKILLMENVPDVIGSKNYSDFMKWYASLETFGYQSYCTTLNAKNFGVPQNRDRCFMVSILGDYNYTFPKPFELKLRIKDMLESDVDEKYYLSEKMISGFIKHNENHAKKRTGFMFSPKNIDEVASCLRANSALGATDNSIIVKGNLSGGKWDKINEGCRRIYSQDGISPTMTGGNQEQKIAEPICLNSQIDGKQPSLQDRIYDSNGISTAITTTFMPSIVDIDRKSIIQRPHGYNKGTELNLCPSITSNSFQENNYVKDYKNIRIRKLTPRECGRLMGASDEDITKMLEINSNSQCYKQFGNSIVVDVLYYIFKQMC